MLGGTLIILINKLGPAAGVSMPSLAGLTLDLDADIGIYEDTAGTTPAADYFDSVAGWSDRDGGSPVFTQATAGARPKLVLNQHMFNGHSAIRFDGIDDWMLGPALSTKVTNSAYTCWIVVRVYVPGTNQVDGYNNQPLIAEAGGYFAFFQRSTEVFGLYNWDGTSDNITRSYAKPFGVCVIEGRHEGGSIYLRVNDGVETSVASGNTQVVSGLLRLARNYNGTLFAQFDVARIIMSNVAETSQVRSEMRAYLTSYYGVGAAQDYTFHDDMREDMTAWGSSGAHYRACQPGPGGLYIREATTTVIASGEMPITDTNIYLQEVGGHARDTGVIHRLDFSLSVGTQQNCNYHGLADAADLVNGPRRPTMRTQDSQHRMIAGDSVTPPTYSVQFEDQLAAGDYVAFLIERTGGAFMLHEIAGAVHLLFVEHTQTADPVAWSFKNNGAAAFTLWGIRSEATAYSLAPVVSHTFSEADTSTIGASDGAAAEETGGSGITPAEFGTNVSVVSQLLTITAAGIGGLAYEAGLADVVITAKVTPRTGSPAGILFRYSDASNYWRAEISVDDNALRIVERNAGSDTIRASVVLNDPPDDVIGETIDDNVECVMQVNLYGNVLRAYLLTQFDYGLLHNNAITYTSSFLGTETKHGLVLRHGGGNGAKAQDLVVWPRLVTDFPGYDVGIAIPVFDHHYRMMRGAG